MGLVDSGAAAGIDVGAGAGAATVAEGVAVAAHAGAAAPASQPQLMISASASLGPRVAQRISVCLAQARIKKAIVVTGLIVTEVDDL